MGYAMAKVAALLCIALLVAHAEGARLLKEAVTAGTYTTEDSVLPPPVDDEAFPASDTPVEYNYAAEDASTDFTDTTSEFASEGFLMTPPPDSETSPEEFPGEDAYVQDQGTDPVMFALDEPAQEEPEPEGTLWHPEDGTDGSDGVTTASFADENNDFPVDSTNSDSNPPRYDFDATTEDPEVVYPAESLATTFDPTDDATEPETSTFVFDESNPGFGN